MMDPTMSSVLRAVRAEAISGERLRINDLLVHQLTERQNAKPQSAQGRIAAGLRVAIDLIGLPALWNEDGPWIELSGSISSAVDGVDVGVYLGSVHLDPTDFELDLNPVRVRVYDGGDDETACAYLSIDETGQLIAALSHAAARAQKDIDEHPAPADSGVES